MRALEPQPDLMPFSHLITAQVEDIDDLGHVGNQIYLRWVLEIAVAHSEALGWAWADYQRVGAGWVVRRHELDYMAQVLVGETVVGTTWIESWKGVSCVRRTELHRAGAPVLRAATTWVFIDFATGKPRKIPDEIRAIFVGQAPRA